MNPSASPTPSTNSRGRVWLVQYLLAVFLAWPLAGCQGDPPPDPAQQEEIRKEHAEQFERELQEG